jgi:anti-sigma factor (TIGR02949 family)
MYTCKNSINLLLEFLDGEISEEEEAHLHEHLSGCPPCVDFFKTYRATPGLVKKALVEKMPSGLAAKLTDYLRARCTKK